jgi:pentapeptide MXKDX repeat protein
LVSLPLVVPVGSGPDLSKDGMKKDDAMSKDGMKKDDAMPKDAMKRQQLM